MIFGYDRKNGRIPQFGRRRSCLKGQVDSLELPETPEITEKTKNFKKVTKYLTKSKETLKIMVEKISRQKVVKIKFSVDSTLSNILYGKKRIPGNAGNQQKAF